MSRSYRELIDLVRDWANRDEDVLSNRIIGDALQWSVDKAYRTLRIPPLENTLIYEDIDSALRENQDLIDATSGTQNGRSITELQIPNDLIEFIYVRGIGVLIQTNDDGEAITYEEPTGRTDAAGNLIIDPATGQPEEQTRVRYARDSRGQLIPAGTSRIFNEKTDIRTFYDQYAEKTNDFAYWTRHGNNMLLTPGFGRGIGYGALSNSVEKAFELHYYRRLPSLHARYAPTVANLNANLASWYFDSTPTDMIPEDAMKVSGTREEVPLTELWRTVDENGVESFSIPEGQIMLGTQVIQAYGNAVDNWFRDENERVALYGALSQCFAYLQDDDQSGKYLQLFTAEIQELNDEDRQRNASGGNVQVNFNGRGLI